MVHLARQARGAGGYGNGGYSSRKCCGGGRGVSGADDEEHAGEHKDEPDAKYNQLRGIESVQLAEQQGAPYEPGDYVERGPRPASARQADVLRGPKGAVVTS